jgi:surface antigen
MKFVLRIIVVLLSVSFAATANADDLDKLIEKYSIQLMEERFSKTVDAQLAAAVEQLFAELVTASSKVTTLPKLQRQPRVTVIVSNEINAYTIPGGDVYVTTGLCGMTGTNRHEVATALAHELGHSARGHANELARKAVLANIVAPLLTKDQAKITSLIWQALTSAKSREDELQADRDAWAILQKSSIKPSATVALFRRFETLQTKTPDLLEQLFATHPPITTRAAHLKNWLIEASSGWDFAFIGRAQAAENQIIAEFANDDPAWQTAYTATTGWPVYNLPNYFSKGYRGECTWLVYALRRDTIPLNPRGGNNAFTWLDRCRENGYAVGETPKPGAIAVWDESVGGGAGHVALVIESLSNNTIRVWDSNWGPEARDSNTTNGRVRHRICSTKGIKGYIYWQNDQSDAPVGYPGYEVAEPRASIMLIELPFTLGDEEGMEMIRLKPFNLTLRELERSTNAKLRLKVRALPAKDPIVSINRVEIGRIVAKTSDWQTYVLNIPPGLLRTRNLLDIETFIPSIGEGYDDCEIKQVELLL